MAEDKLLGAARAALGQGLGMGWGDEAEAWLRSRLAGYGTYEQELPKIRQQYANYVRENPVMSTVSEVAGGALPGVGLMMLPGGQGAGAATTVGALTRLAGLGAATGAISGAGSAQEGGRASGAVTGATLGGILGLGVPVALRGAQGVGSWLRDRLFPSQSSIENRAGQKMNRALEEANMQPADIGKVILADRALGVPTVVANTNPALADLAEAVAQRTGKGTRQVENTLRAQTAGSRERTYRQVEKGLQPGDYYADLETLRNEMRTRAAPLYAKAYEHGEVNNPEVLKFLELPQFQQGVKEAQQLLAAEGRKMDLSRPTVEMLDQVKRGVDSLIERETDKITGRVTPLGRVYAKTKTDFLKALDAAVPDYELARGVYGGGAELIDAMRAGMNEFGRMKHEEVIKKIAGMNEAEKAAFRTGVSRGLYDKIMTPTTNFNAAQRVINSPETTAKLQPLFDDPAHFRLFQAALGREAQLYHEAQRILGGSQTAKRGAMRESLEEGSAVGDAVAQAVTGGPLASLTGLVARVARNGSLTPEVSDKLAAMLMSKSPEEVASVIKFLENHAKAAAPKAVAASAAEKGAVTGATTAIWPGGTAPSADLEADLEGRTAPAGPDLESDLEAESKKTR